MVFDGGVVHLYRIGGRPRYELELVRSWVDDDWSPDILAPVTLAQGAEGNIFLFGDGENKISMWHLRDTGLQRGASVSFDLEGMLSLLVMQYRRANLA